MVRKNNIVLLIIIAIFAVTLWILFPIDSTKLGREGLRLGLDLVGGVHLVYQADFSQNTTADAQAAMDRTILTIENRIDTFGVTEPVIQQLGTDRIMIQLPGFTDIDAAKSLVEQTGFLEFREVEKNSAGDIVYLSDYLSGNVTNFINTAETSDRVFVSMSEDSNYSKPVAIMSKSDAGLVFTTANGTVIDRSSLQEYGTTPSWIPARGNDGTPLTGSLLADAQPYIIQNTSEPIVNIKWNDEGAIIFDQIAARLFLPKEQTATLANLLGIFLDNNLLSAPAVRAQQFEGKGEISGRFTLEEAEDLANLLKSGSLPLPLVKPPVYQEKVSATLGAEFIDKCWKAGLIGLALVMIFMIAYYRLPGVMASLSLIFYATLTLAIYKIWPAPQITLTLAGLGGFIASIGMAVDANILIFERMKEELRDGRTLGAAIEAGFNRAWSAIRDSNVTTILVCIILALVGSNMTAGAPIKWFGITLLIGIVVSMFTAIVVTRTLLRIFVGTPLANKLGLFNVTGGKNNV